MERVLRIRDPDLGDRLLIVPVSTAGLGVKGSRSFPQFRALATYQGVAIAPLSDGLRVKIAEAGVVVSAAGGLLVSGYGDRRGAGGEEPVTGVRLFDQEAWRRQGEGAYAEVRQALLAAIVEAPPGRVDAARLDLSRFYFAHGLIAEALSVLRLVSQENRRLATDPQVLLLRAVGAFLAGNLERAADTLSNPVLEGEWEATLWRRRR